MALAAVRAQEKGARYLNSLTARAREARQFQTAIFPFCVLPAPAARDVFPGSRLAALRSYAVAADGHPRPDPPLWGPVNRFRYRYARARGTRRIPDDDFPFCVWPAPADRAAFPGSTPAALRSYAVAADGPRAPDLPLWTTLLCALRKRGPVNRFRYPYARARGTRRFHLKTLSATVGRRSSGLR